MKTKLVVLMLTDLSGFTEFASRSTRLELVAAVKQQQKIIPPIIDEHAGRLLKWIGDAALAVFESATDAVLCGHRVQSEFLNQAERGEFAIGARVKVVVHVGEVNIDTDEDVYGSAVNELARVEKAATDGEVYFTDAVRLVISPSEIPFEPYGEFEFKGVPGPLQVYRTCFGQSPIDRRSLILVQTSFVHVLSLADEHGWEAVHPALDRVAGAIIEATRRNGGTNRGVMQTGCFLSFDSLTSALSAVRDWTRVVAAHEGQELRLDERLIRIGIHSGELRLMRYTTMGRDVDIVRTLSAMGFGGEVLLSESAMRCAEAEGLRSEKLFGDIAVAELRECSSRRRWTSKYGQPTVGKITVADLVAHFGDDLS